MLGEVCLRLDLPPLVVRERLARDGRRRFQHLGHGPATIRQRREGKRLGHVFEVGADGDDVEADPVLRHDFGRVEERVMHPVALSFDGLANDLESSTLGVYGSVRQR